MWQKIEKPRNLDEWKITPATVDAYYDPTANQASVSRLGSPKLLKRLGRLFLLRGFFNPPFSRMIGKLIVFLGYLSTNRTPGQAISHMVPLACLLPMSSRSA